MFGECTNEITEKTIVGTEAVGRGGVVDGGRCCAVRRVAGVVGGYWGWRLGELGRHGGGFCGRGDGIMDGGGVWLLK